jgi:thiosulfate reductase cytochrome b subunit
MIIFFHFRLGWIFLLKYVCFCVSSVVIHFWVPTQKIKKYKKYISKIYSEEIKKKYEREKDVGTPIKWLEIGWGGQKYKNWNLIVYF